MLFSTLRQRPIKTSLTFTFFSLKSQFFLSLFLITVGSNIFLYYLIYYLYVRPNGREIFCFFF